MTAGYGFNSHSPRGERLRRYSTQIGHVVPMYTVGSAAMNFGD